MSPGISFIAGTRLRLSEAGRFSGVVAITSGLVPAAIVARELDMRVIDAIWVVSYAQEKIQGE
jgi:xanthine phosphoribosyltransferase